MSESGKRAVSKAQKGRAKSPATRKKISDSLKGRPLREETRSKMSLAKKGKPLSEENKKNLWKNRSRTFSEQHRQNMSRARKFVKVSDATKLKMSSSLRGKPHKCSLCGEYGHTKPTCKREQVTNDCQTGHRRSP